MLLAVRVNLDHFMRDLIAGDPVVWAIVAGVVFFSGLGAYQKLRRSSTCGSAAAMDGDDGAAEGWTQSRV
jgi:hypothetical protein